MTRQASSITRPSTCKWNAKTHAVTLFWKHDAPENGDYHMRGGICWPVNSTSTQGILARGFLVVCGQNIQTSVITVLEEEEFLTTEPYTQDDVLRDGLTSHLNRAFATYLCEMYYQHQPHEMCRMHAAELYRSRQVSHQPHFVRVDWDDDDGAAAAMMQMGNDKRLRMREGPVAEALRRWSVQPGVFLQEVHALTCAANGLRRFPWRKPREE